MNMPISNSTLVRYTAPDNVERHYIIMHTGDPDVLTKRNIIVVAEGYLRTLGTPWGQEPTGRFVREDNGQIFDVYQNYLATPAE